MFCSEGRDMGLAPDTAPGCAPGSPKRRKPPLAPLAPAGEPPGRFAPGAPPAVAGRSLIPLPKRPGMAAPVGLLPCSMARCCCEKGTRSEAAGGWWVKNRVEAGVRGVKAAACEPYCRLLRLGAIPTCPRINPAVRNCSLPGWLTEVKRPLRKSSAASDETPFATRAFLYVLYMFTFVILMLRFKPP